MATRTLQAKVAASAEEVIRLLSAAENFPGYAPDLLSVTREEDRSDWVLAFGNGVATWTQRSRVTADRIEFEQVDGDFVRYDGHWSVTPDPQGSTVEFTVHYRTSVPHLAGAIESAVGRVLSRTALAILTGVAGPARVTAGAHHLRDLPDGFRQDLAVEEADHAVR